MVLGWPLIMVPAQLLWLNLVTKGLQDLALAFEPGEPDVLEHRHAAPRADHHPHAVVAHPAGRRGDDRRRPGDVRLGAGPADTRSSRPGRWR
jgi:hypothetical protein